MAEDGGTGEGICCGGLCAGTSGTNFSTCVTCGIGCPSCAGGCQAGTACVSEGVEDESGTYVPIGVCLPSACSLSVNGDPCAFGQVEGSAGIGLDFDEGQREGICCSGICVDVGQDPGNCGLCGIACASGICAAGPTSATVCLPAQPDSDCLATCPTNTVCVDGSCVESGCQNPSTTADLCAASDGHVGMCCIGVLIPSCADLASDPANCGGCGFVCPSGQTCSGGVCSGTPPNCGLGRIGAFCDLDAGPSFVCCPGIGCTDTATDDSNCGLCGIQCAAGQSCNAGACG